MTGWDFALWGFLGAMSLEGIELFGAIRRVGRWPWRSPGGIDAAPFFIGVLIRAGIGALLSLAMGISGQITAPFSALTVGLAAPLLIERLARLSMIERGSPEARSLARRDFAFDSSAPAPEFQTGHEPPYARISISKGGAEIIKALEAPEIEEGIAVDVGMSLSDVRRELHLLSEKKLIAWTEGTKGPIRLTEGGKTLQRRLQRGDPIVVIEPN